jgi:hypothetical protein
VNLDRSYRQKIILQGLQVDENDQDSMRRLLKAQHRWLFDDEDKQLLCLEPLTLSTLKSTTPARTTSPRARKVL